jgi:propanediol utilization protein
MELKPDLIEQIIREILVQTGELASAGGVPAGASSSRCEAGLDPFLTTVGVSNRHVHLCRADLDVLFGPGCQLQRKKAMKQPGQFAAEETVTLRGPKGQLLKVRVLGPLRKDTQIEVSVADGYALGISPPLRMSGRLDGTPGIEIIGPQGTVRKEKGVIVAMRHVHMLPETAERLGLRNGDVVEVEVPGKRGGVMREVAVRVADASAYELHIDVEEANAFCLRNDDLVRIRTH